VPYQLLADVVLVVHLGVILFVVGGLLLTLVGNRFARWSWVNSPWFRLAHLTTIAFVVFQAWLGQVCSLTTLESWLRQRAGASGYERGFIEYWVRTVANLLPSPKLGVHNHLHSVRPTGGHCLVGLSSALGPRQQG
jgi:hypothetical protein